ncbi:universal stress protein [Moraxella lincolnii]|uniref:universal stress protein n=1 Tax=Lwoffella lincolnii TaxID=90241 RepID=UPI0039841CA3
MNYQHILLVTDLKNDADLVAAKAKMMLNAHPNAQLSVLHVVKDNMVGFGYELIPASSIYDGVDKERQQIAQQKSQELLKRHDIDSGNININTAISSSNGIISYCHSHQVDLMIIGRHERHGLSALLKGTTIDNILPDINCDVFIVQL